MTYLDTFRLFLHILRYIYFELDKTGSNICNGDDVKMVTSDLSARINDVLRYVGITRNMNAYIYFITSYTDANTYLLIIDKFLMNTSNG